MKFSKQIDANAKQEWRLYYMDYKYLKQLIKLMKQRLNEGQSLKEEERKFSAAVEREIDKVNTFFLQMDREIQAKLQNFRLVLSKNFDEKQSGYSGVAIENEIDQLATVLVDLYAYTTTNFEGFRKILKKHDRHTNMEASPWFLARCRGQPFYSSSEQFGQLLVKFSECCSKARKLLGRADAGKDVDTGGFQAFERQTVKYWVKGEDIMKVKTIIAKHLPVYIFASPSTRFPKDPTDYASIASCYYDNLDLDLYEGRLRKSEGAQCIRFRTYQSAPEVFVERKTHHESWVTGGSSVKERFDLDATDVYDFIRGSYKVEHFMDELEKMGKSEKEINAAVKLFVEIQNLIQQKQLVPTCTTAYDRTAFQLPGDASVRISIDTNLQMIREKQKLTNDGRWHKDIVQTSQDDIHDFPYAVLEVKLMTQEGVEPPDWVTELTNGPLVRMAHKFSKYIHGCAMLLPKSVPCWPPWIHEFDNIEQQKKEEEEKKKERQMENVDYLLDDEDDLVESDSVQLLPMKSGGASYYSAPPRTDPVQIPVKKRSILDRLEDFFSFDKRIMEKDGKPIMSRMKIEPKTYFANERTFLQWMSFSIIIQAIGIALISVPNTNMFGLTSGFFFVLCSLVFMGYALFQFRWRAARIRNNQPGRYDDQFGPILLVVVMVLAVVVNAIFFLLNSAVDAETSTTA